MLTKLILKLSLFAAFVTVVYCILSEVSVLESLKRGMTVLGGLYTILIIFFLFLRFILTPVLGKQVDEPRKRAAGEVPEAETVGAAVE